MHEIVKLNCFLGLIMKASFWSVTITYYTLFLKMFYLNTAIVF